MSLTSQTNELELRVANKMLATQPKKVEKRVIINSADEFTDLLNRYVKNKDKYDKHYKFLTTEKIKEFKDVFKNQEEALSRSYNLLKTKK